MRGGGETLRALAPIARLDVLVESVDLFRDVDANLVSNAKDASTDQPVTEVGALAVPILRILDCRVKMGGDELVDDLGLGRLGRAVEKGVKAT